MQGINLNLGCSDDLKPGYVNIDRITDSPNQMPLSDVTDSEDDDYHFRDDYTYTHDLSHPLPFFRSEVDSIYAKDVFEHIDSSSFPGNKGKIWVLTESYRVLKNGGRLEFLVPCVHMADMRMNPGAFADPTHVSFWTYDDRYYFTEEWNNPQGERGRLGPAYGITCRFKIIVWELQEYGVPGERRSKVHAILEAVK